MYISFSLSKFKVNGICLIEECSHSKHKSIPYFFKAEFHLVVEALVPTMPRSSWVSGYLVFWSADESWRKQHGDLFSGHSCPMPAPDLMSEAHLHRKSRWREPAHRTPRHMSTLSQSVCGGNVISSRCSETSPEWNSTTGKQGAQPGACHLQGLN